VNNNNRRVSPDNYIVEAISLDPDPTDKVLTWMTLQTPAGTLQAALTREGVEQLWGMLDTVMAHWSCDCPRCTAEREAEEAAAKRMH